MRSLFIMLVAVFLMTLPAVAADWPEDARLAMEAAGARLKTPPTPPSGWMHCARSDRSPPPTRMRRMPC